MKILVACEESQAVANEFRRLGHEAYSADIKPTSGANPEWHYEQDVIPLLKESWDMIVAFPPCTHIAVSGAKHFEKKRKDGRQQAAIDFFMEFVNAGAPKIAIENPVGIMSTIWRKPDQIIDPFQFGDPYQKRTCLWLKGLPLLVPTNVVEPEERIRFASGRSMAPWIANPKGKPGESRGCIRSKTFPGIAQAMAEQWAGDIRPDRPEEDLPPESIDGVTADEKERMAELANIKK